MGSAKTLVARSGSECEILYASRCFPLRLQTQTFLDAVGTSHLCQEPTWLFVLYSMRLSPKKCQTHGNLFAFPASNPSVVQRRRIERNAMRAHANDTATA